MGPSSRLGQPLPAQFTTTCEKQGFFIYNIVLVNNRKPTSFFFEDFRFDDDAVLRVARVCWTITGDENE